MDITDELKSRIIIPYGFYFSPTYYTEDAYVPLNKITHSNYSGVVFEYLPEHRELSFEGIEARMEWVFPDYKSYRIG